MVSIRVNRRNHPASSLIRCVFYHIARGRHTRILPTFPSSGVMSKSRSNGRHQTGGISNSFASARKSS